MSWMERVSWTKFQISKRVTVLGYSPLKSPSIPPLFLIRRLSALFFSCLVLADLVRQIQLLPIFVDFIRAESYGSVTECSGAPRISLDLKLNVSDKHVTLAFSSFDMYSCTPHSSCITFFFIIYLIFLAINQCIKYLIFTSGLHF